ncbi:MAG: hypothetical protein QOJ80_2470 [Mycobacterium sp.]|jgi:SAM-dependent methyltransferase|nr:hypothetical protein [Mycobacterium sp.]
MDYLERTRDGYDATAVEYARRFHRHLDDKPVELAMLSAFAGLVKTTGGLAVADVGCGTGATTAILHQLGTSPTGIDLSPNMIAEARRLNPQLPFHVGTMTRLDLAEGSVGGVCAWYSTIHVPDDDLAQVFAEFGRVLIPGGIALLAFQVGDHPLHLTEAFGVSVDVEYHRRRPEAVEAMLSAAGLLPYARTVRDADDDGLESTPQAFLLARKGPVARYTS